LPILFFNESSDIVFGMYSRIPELAEVTMIEYGLSFRLIYPISKIF